MAPEAANNLVSLCLFQVSLSSRNTPGYLARLACLISQVVIGRKNFSLLSAKKIKKLVLLTFSDF